jgi:hypothetical protein
MPKNTCAGFAAGKTSSQHSIQDWSDDDSDDDCRMFLGPMPIAYAFPAAPSPGIVDEDVVEAVPLNQGPPPGTRADKKGSPASARFRDTSKTYLLSQTLLLLFSL